ncbi:hypothetical protein FRB90_011083, partial [Tulasnella sp. 427]
MPSKPSLSQVRASNASVTWPYRPTAVFVGGTSGIGEFTAKSLAEATKGNAHIIIVGRSLPKAEKIIASFPKSPNARYEFVQCDVLDMKNTVSAANEIKRKVPEGGLNYLVLSQGIWPFGEAKPALNGIDARFVLNFYSRWKFVDELMPLLEKAGNNGQDARVMSVLNPSVKIPIDLDDLGMKKGDSGFARANMSTAYTNVLIEEYSRLHQRLSFYNIFPGIVDTPNSDAALWWTKPIVYIARFFMITGEESGERMLAALLRPEYKEGAFYVDQFGEPVDAQLDNEE